MKKFFKSKFTRILVVLVIITALIATLLSSLSPHAYAKEKITITEFSVSSAPTDITSGPDGNIWFALFDAHKIGKITPSAGGITEYLIPSSNSGPYGITDGPDGNLWYTKLFGGYIIGRITPGGTITEFGDPGTVGTYAVFKVTNGPDGNLWFTLFGKGLNHVGRITPSGTITDFPIPLRDPNIMPADITAGSDGNLWYAREPHWIGRITPSGIVTEFAVPTHEAYPRGIASGPDGNLWFTEYFGNKIGRITPSGEITEFVIPTEGSLPSGITGGPDGNLWFTEIGINKIGRITPNDEISEFPIPTNNSSPYEITAGHDGNLWFTESGSNKIGRVNLSDIKDPGPPDRDDALLSPFNNGITWTVISGYYNNRNQSETGCHIGLGPDHCRNQLFGLDMVPDQQNDTAILAPGNGKVSYRGKLEGGCIGLRITLDNGLNLNVCHFAAWNVGPGDRVLRGKVLGTRSSSHVHLSLDDRYRIGTLCPGQDRCFLPIPFDGQHAIEGVALDPDQNGETVTLPYPLCNQRNVNCQFKVGFRQYQNTFGTSTNIALQ